MNDKPEDDNKKKGQWLNIVLVVVISAFITFMITSTYCKNKLMETDKLLSEETEEIQAKHITSALEDDFDTDSVNVESFMEFFKEHETNMVTYRESFDEVGLKMIDSSHDSTDNYGSYTIESEATFVNAGDVPLYINDFNVDFIWEDAQSVSFRGIIDDEEIDVTGTEQVIYPKEEVTLLYEATIPSDIAYDEGMTPYRFKYDFRYGIIYFVDLGDIEAVKNGVDFSSRD